MMVKDIDEIDQLFERLRNDEPDINDGEFMRGVLDEINTSEQPNYGRLGNVILIGLALIIVAVVFPWQQLLVMLATPPNVTPTHLLLSALGAIAASFIAVRWIDSMS